MPDPVSEWLADVAEERGLTEQELLARLLAEEDLVLDGDGTDVVDRMAEIEASVQELDGRIDEKIEDVRDRVLQVKREADGKAPADHDHPEVDQRVDRLTDNVAAIGRDFVGVDDDLTRLEERVEAVDDRVSAGFSNYEEVLEYLVESTDELDRKLNALAREVVGLRERTQRLASTDAKRAAVDRLRDSASEHGITEARCEDCDETVHLGLLTSPNCPHCGTQFGEVEPKTGFFGSHVLRTGSQPALEGDVGEAPTDLDDLLASDRDEAPPVDPTSKSGSDAPAEDSAGRASAEPANEEESTGEKARAEGTRERATTTVDDPATAAGSEGRGSPGGPADLEVEAISGIGSAYSDRLERAGVETVGDLALADPERLAGAADIADDRVDGWVDRARQMIESD